MLAAGLAVRAGTRGGDFSTIVAPQIEGEQRAPQLVARAHQKLERFGALYGTNEIHGAVQDSGGLAGLHRPLRRCAEHTRQARGCAREVGPGSRVTTPRSRVYPRP